MVITGQKVFKVVYFASILFHVVFIAYSLLNNRELSPTYITLTSTSIVVLSLIMITLGKNKSQE